MDKIIFEEDNIIFTHFTITLYYVVINVHPVSYYTRTTLTNEKPGLKALLLYYYQ